MIRRDRIKFEEANKMDQRKTFVIKIPGFDFQLICTDVRTLTRHQIQFFLFAVYVIVSLLLMYIALPATIILAYYNPPVIPVSLAYWSWIVWDRKTPYKGGRKLMSKWFRNCRMFAAGREHFSLRLVKTADLPANVNYLLGHFPHGTVPISTPLNFTTNANNIDSLYPGIDFHFAAFDTAFKTPFLRELYLALGGFSCSESSMKYILNQRPSKGVLIMPGGTAEIQYSKPGSEYRIIKTRRKGFVRIALETGTPLVPVFTFGENNAFIPYKLLNTNIIKRLFGIDLFFLNGRGILQHNFGILPRNVPVTSIVGKPIPIPKVEHPTPELIDKYHEIFFEELHELFEKYKIEYDNADGKSQLIML